MVREFLYPSFVLIALLGVIGIMLLLCCRNWTTMVLNRLGELPPKIIIECIQFASGFTSILSAFAVAAEKKDWFQPAIASAVSVFVWKVVQIIVDLRQKGEAGRAKATSEALTRLLFGIRASVGKKLERIQKAKSAGKQPTIKHVREALTPEPHLNDLLDQLATVLHGQLQHGSPKVNVRVGVYVNQSGYMCPIHGISLKNPGYNPFNSYERHKPSYELNLTNRSCHVVRCVVEKRTIVVPDCERAALTGNFFFSHDDQRQYLSSMIAYHLGVVVNGEGNLTEAAITVDADQAGFFKDADRDTLETILQEFGIRIRLELALQSFLEKRETTS